MERTPTGTPVGVDNPYEHVEKCDHLTSNGACRFAYEQALRDPEFAEARRANDYACPVGTDDWEWQDCPHFRSRGTNRECKRCGLTERRIALENDRPLLEEHHLSYPDDETSHEITIYLCRWCHAKIHNSWARITDDASPDPAALAAAEARRTRELEELEFRSAADRRESTPRD